jgi:oligopeptide transport system substrate-binding protein
MKKFIVLSGALLCALLVIFLNYREEKKSKEGACAELRTNMMGGIITFDPRIALDANSMQMGYMLFSGLTALDEQGNAQLDLAESYRISEDRMTYWFTLKKLHWSDGSPLTAYDFEESWNEYTREDFPASLWEMVSMIRNCRGKQERDFEKSIGVRALDPQTVEIQLEFPTSYFLQLLAHPTLFPVHHSMRGKFLQRKGVDPSAIVCSGPFTIHNFKDRVEILLTKNPHYHNASSVSLEKIRMSCITDAQTALALFEKKEIDWLGLPLSELPIDALTELKARGVLQNHPLLDAVFLYFNTKEYPFTNTKLRKALTLAIDRQAIIKNVLQTQDLAALGCVPVAQKKERWHAYFADHDENAARAVFNEALAELHISVEEFPEIIVSYNTSDKWHRVMQAIQEQWRTVLGIRVKIENAEWQVHMDKIKKGNYQIARYGRFADFIDPLAFLKPFLSYNATQNYCKWENKEFDSLILSAEQAASESERQEYLERAEKVLMEEMPLAPLTCPTAYCIAQEGVKDVFVSPLYHVNFSKAHFEKIHE